MPQALSVPIHSIVHPTDFSEASQVAFAHALKLGLAAKAKFTILHSEEVAGEGDVDWSAFPGVRSTLARWGILEADAPQAEVVSRLGLDVRKVDVVDKNPVHGIGRFLARHPADLIVLATHGRSGLSGWLQGAVAGPIAREALSPILFLPEGAPGLVDPATGEARLARILIPVDHRPRPEPAMACAQQVARLLREGTIEVTLLHVGPDERQPALRRSGEPGFEIERMARPGQAAETILAVANELGVDMIAMATEGRQGLLDALRGSTSEQVVRRASCPVLAVPTGD